MYQILLDIFVFFFRYFAVCEPYNYRVEAKLENVNIRVLKYLLIVIAISCFINFPRFFETELVSLTLNRTLDTSVETVTIVSYEVTELRKNPEYIRLAVRGLFMFLINLSRFYINWFRAIFTCILPLSALIFFNVKIFRGIR